MGDIRLLTKRALEAILKIKDCSLQASHTLKTWATHSSSATTDPTWANGKSATPSATPTAGTILHIAIMVL